MDVDGLPHGFQPSNVVQDFFQAQYYALFSFHLVDSWWNSPIMSISSSLLLQFLCCLDTLTCSSSTHTHIHTHIYIYYTYVYIYICDTHRYIYIYHTHITHVCIYIYIHVGTGNSWAFQLSKENDLWNAWFPIYWRVCRLPFQSLL